LKKYLVIAALLCAVVAASGCIMTQGTGSGKVINQSKSIRGVNQVNLNGTGTLVLQQGDEETLVVEAEDNIIPHVQTKVNGNNLDISYDTNTPMPTKDVRFIITVKDINSVTINGAGKVQSSGLNVNQLAITLNGAGESTINDLNTKKLTVTMNAGKVTMTGNATEQTLNINGAGDYNTQGLESNIATININGAGTAVVKVAQTLNVIISGAGTVSYFGNPQVNQQINGPGTVTKAG
jgi:hypothetical protein